MSKPGSSKDVSGLHTVAGLQALESYDKVTPGLQSTIGTVEPSETFGDSGDSFNHSHWRGLFHFIANTRTGNNFINGLGQKLLLRGQV